MVGWTYSRAGLVHPHTAASDSGHVFGPYTVVCDVKVDDPFLRVDSLFVRASCVVSLSVLAFSFECAGCQYTARVVAYLGSSSTNVCYKLEVVSIQWIESVCIGRLPAHLKRRQPSKLVPRKPAKGKASKTARRATRRKQGGNPIGVGAGQVTRVVGRSFDTDVERVTLRFVDNVVVTAGAGAGALTIQRYGINTPRIPERSTMTGVSQGWANTIAKFSHYLCYGSKIRWQVSQLPGTTSSTTAAVRMVLFPRTEAGPALTSVADADVQKYAKSFQFAPSSSSTVPNASPYNRWTGRHAMTVSKIEGEPNLRQSSFEALTSSDPSLVPTWDFYFQDILASATDQPSFLFRVELEYDCVFWDRLTQVNALAEVPALCRRRDDSKEEKKAPQQRPSPLPLPSPPPGYVLVKRLSQLD